MSARRHNPRSNVEWKVIAVDEADALSFAHKLQQVLTELTEQGYNVVSQMTRGSALIITATKLLSSPQQEATPPPPGDGKMSN